MNYRILRTDSGHPDFIHLVQALDADLAIRDGEDHAFYAQFNSIDTIRAVVLLYHNEVALGCGALKPYDAQTMEFKRMFVLPTERGKGIATYVLQELEAWALELGARRCILETGVKQPEAIQLYKKNGYALMPNYGQYAGVSDSVCFQKMLTT